MQDVAQFTGRLRDDAHRRAWFSEGCGPVTVSRAPGRLDVMGGVADYSGALVAETTIAEAALVALRRRRDRQLRVWSVGVETEGFQPQVTLSLDTFFEAGGQLACYGAVQARLAGSPRARWAAYVAGCFYTLLAEGALAPDQPGADLLLDSRVPLGAGVSSSAAIEVAVMQAIRAAYELDLDGVSLARLAQTVENRVVGAPCGIMDQMSSALGVHDSLLLLLCRPHDVRGTQRLPDGVHVFGINSAVKHSVGGGAYTRARVGAFMGRRLIRQERDCEFLTQVTPTAFRRNGWHRRLPARLRGSEFLAACGETGDPVTRVDPETVYPVRAATAHAVYEHDRVTRFVARLAQPRNLPQALALAGRLMYASHWSYGQIGLGSRETDLLVRLARAAGPDQGIYGAKITGGGSGGTVALLAAGDGAAAVIQRIAGAYRAATGRVPQIFQGGQSPGALEFGVRRLAWDEGGL